jgi:hypothetical protein
MAKKLFVGGLAWATTDDSLRGAFEKFGSVQEAVVVLDRETGRSRGFGFVTFTQDADADRAVAEMNGAELDGRSINVNEANERRPRSGGFGGGGSGYGGGGGGGGGRGGYGGGGGGYGGGGGRGGYGGGGGGGSGGYGGGGGGRGSRGSGGGGRRREDGDSDRW